MKFFVCLLSVIALVICAPDVYWRQYDGIVPEDAIIGATDGIYNSYVGRVAIYDKGLYIGQLFGGIPSIEVAGFTDKGENEVHTRKDYIEILCSNHQESLEWVPATNENIYDIPGVLVEGGYHFNATNTTNPYELYVGRYNLTFYDERGYKVGKIDPYFRIQGPYLYFVSNDSVYSSLRFEVLTYRAPRLFDEDINGTDVEAVGS